MRTLPRPTTIALLSLSLILPSASAQDKVRFNRDVRPILAEHCYRCHGPDSASRKAKLRLDNRDVAVQRGAIAPGHADKSELVARIFADDADTVMPPPRVKNPLTKSQKNTLRRWIDEGAEYERHWSFQPIPKTVPVPEIADKWIREPIDAFILDRLRREKLEPAPEASRETWLRRVSFDLTGLPPKLAEIDAFLADQSPDAYGKVVDRLLASPAYGERMANDWLDVARYADTFGYQADRLMHVWPWRDWVIDAFRKNLPYDQFVLQQTAGDLLPNATRDQKVATAFNRLHRATNEGGSVPEEFRVEYVADRLRTNGMAFLGLTLECCRCHDHKFDPISTKEYYRLSAFFDNIDEAGLYSHFTETAPTPALPLYGPNQETEHQAMLTAIRVKEAERRGYVIDHRPNVVPGFADIELPKPAAHFTFDGATPTGDIRVVPGKFGKALEFGGDDSYSCGKAGQFGRTTPFTMSMWLMPAESSPRQVVLHRSRAAEDSAFRGYSLVLDDGHLVVSLVHFWPGDAIQVRTKSTIPIHVWSHVAFRYYGSSKADGVRLYVDGKPVEVEVVRDRLTRDIVHRAEWGDSDTNVPLALGARFRDVGFRKGRIDELQIFDRDLSDLEIARVGGFPLPTDEASRLDHWRHRDPAVVAFADDLRKLRERENDFIAKIPQIMTMRELPARRTTHLLYRGAYDAPREVVQPGVPDAILPMDASLPRNRLGFARWLLDDKNPLTARVEANRLWQMFFQRGLVVTAEDFGSQGTPPTHPELLDWLSRRFVDSGWNVRGKALQRRWSCRRLIGKHLDHGTQRLSSVIRTIICSQEARAADCRQR